MGKGRERFEAYYKRFLANSIKRAERKLKKAIDRYMSQHIYELDGKRLLLQKGSCDQCCFFKTSDEEMIAGYKGCACVAPFYCRHILKELFRSYHFVEIDKGL